jgi:hypothetical protein
MRLYREKIVTDYLLITRYFIEILRVYFAERVAKPFAHSNFSITNSNAFLSLRPSLYRLSLFPPVSFHLVTSIQSLSTSLFPPSLFHPVAFRLVAFHQVLSTQSLPPSRFPPNHPLFHPASISSCLCLKQRRLLSLGS